MGFIEVTDLALNDGIEIPKRPLLGIVFVSLIPH
jgi:hypothetical protein